MRKVKSFYFNELSNNNFSFESEQFFDFCFPLAIHWSRTVNIQHVPLLCCKMKGIFQES